MIGLDSTALIDLQKEDKSLIELLSGITEKINFNMMSYLEIMFGLDKSDKGHIEEEKFFDKLFASAPVMDLTIQTSKKARDILWKLRKKGLTIDSFDCAIAGIYLENGINQIITKNVKHFEKISSLKIIEY